MIIFGYSPLNYLSTQRNSRFIGIHLRKALHEFDSRWAFDQRSRQVKESLMKIGK